MPKEALKEWLYRKELINYYDLTLAAARFWSKVKAAEEYHTREEQEWKQMCEESPDDYQGDYEPDFGSAEDEQAYYAWKLLESCR